VQEVIHNYGEDQPIHLIWDRQSSTVSVEQFMFEEITFSAFIAYVNRGGYPGWQDEIRPHYVQEMMQKLAQISSSLLVGGEILLPCT
jgi:hypothetical protein